MDRGVLYVLAGAKHWNHIVVSIASLKQHWNGPVCIAAADEQGHYLADKIVADKRLGDVCKVDVAEIYKARRNGAYLLKTYMIDFSPFESTVFIDADTLVTGDLTPMFPTEDEVRLTEFEGWVTTGRMMSGRIKKWKHVLPERVEEMLRNPYPALNTGVMGFSKKCSKFAKLWHDTTKQNVSFMCDELAAQLIYLDVTHCIMDGRYNASVVHNKNLDEAVVIHGHGFKFIRKERGQKIWLPRYEQAWAQDYAGLREWTLQAKNAPESYLKGTDAENRSDWLWSRKPQTCDGDQQHS